MAYFRRSVDQFSPTKTIRIIGSETLETHTEYVIEVTIGSYKWSVRHRYSDFNELHTKLTTQFRALDKGLLPGKKLFGNQSEQFIQRRQLELEKYLQTLVRILPAIPSALARFLGFNNYEVRGIAQSLSETLFHRGDEILSRDDAFHITPLQLNAISTRLKLPEPPCDSGEASQDLGHALDFFTKLHHLKIEGSLLAVGSSNINMNELSFDMHFFKNLTTLQLNGCRVERMCEVDYLKRSLQNLRVHNSLSSIKELLLLGLDSLQEVSTLTEVVVCEHSWLALTHVDLSVNRIATIDDSVRLVPYVERLNLSYNRIESFDNLDTLSRLRVLDLSHNLIRRLPALHTRLGNVTTVNLSHNKLESLQCFAKLYSLERLDISHNDITQIAELQFVADLPCLELLDTQSNQIQCVVDYRTTVLVMFGQRAKEVMLDGVRASHVELDAVEVRLALRKSRDKKALQNKPPRKAPVRDAIIVDTTPAVDLAASCPMMSFIQDHSTAALQINNYSTIPSTTTTSRYPRGFVPSTTTSVITDQSNVTSVCSFTTVIPSTSDREQTEVDSTSSVSLLPPNQTVGDVENCEITLPGSARSIIRNIALEDGAATQDHGIIQTSNTGAISDETASETNTRPSYDLVAAVESINGNRLTEVESRNLAVHVNKKEDECSEKLEVVNDASQIEEQFQDVEVARHSDRVNDGEGVGVCGEEISVTVDESGTKEYVGGLNIGEALQEEERLRSADHYKENLIDSIAARTDLAESTSTSSSSSVSSASHRGQTMEKKSVPQNNHHAEENCTINNCLSDEGPSMIPEPLKFQLGHQRNNRLNRSNDDSVGNSTSAAELNFILPDTLPDHHDSSLVSYLQSLRPDSSSLFNKSADSPESPIHILWCSVLSYSHPEEEFPGCVFITTERVQLFRVLGLHGDNRIPCLSPQFDIPLPNIQQLAIGYGSLYLQIEEAFVASLGTFTLLTMNSVKTDRFVDAVKRAYRRSTPDLDAYEDPNIVATDARVDYALRWTLNSYEGLAEPKDISIRLYMLVVVGRPIGRTCSLVFTTRYIYVVRQDYGNVPSPSFVISPPLEPVFEVVSVFPVAGRVINISMCDTPVDDDSDSLAAASFATTISGVTGPASNGSAKSPNFIGYGVRVTFHLGADGVQILEFRVPTSNLRDKFLSTLKAIRSEISMSQDGCGGKIRTHRSGGLRLKKKNGEHEDSSMSSGGSCPVKISSDTSKSHRHRNSAKEKLLISDDAVHRQEPSRGLVSMDRGLQHVKISSAPNLTFLQPPGASCVDAQPEACVEHGMDANRLETETKFVRILDQNERDIEPGIAQVAVHQMNNVNAAGQISTLADQQSASELFCSPQNEPLQTSSATFSVSATVVDGDDFNRNITDIYETTERGFNQKCELLVKESELHTDTAKTKESTVAGTASAADLDRHNVDDVDISLSKAVAFEHYSDKLLSGSAVGTKTDDFIRKEWVVFGEIRSELDILNAGIISERFPNNCEPEHLDNLVNHSLHHTADNVDCDLVRYQDKFNSGINCDNPDSNERCKNGTSQNLGDARNNNRGTNEGPSQASKCEPSTASPGEQNRNDRSSVYSDAEDGEKSQALLLYEDVGCEASNAVGPGHFDHLPETRDCTVNCENVEIAAGGESEQAENEICDARTDAGLDAMDRWDRLNDVRDANVIKSNLHITDPTCTDPDQKLVIKRFCEFTSDAENSDALIALRENVNAAVVTKEDLHKVPDDGYNIYAKGRSDDDDEQYVDIYGQCKVEDDSSGNEVSQENQGTAEDLDKVAEREVKENDVSMYTGNERLSKEIFQQNMVDVEQCQVVMYEKENDADVYASNEESKECKESVSLNMVQVVESDLVMCENVGDLNFVGLHQEDHFVDKQIFAWGNNYSEKCDQDTVAIPAYNETDEVSDNLRAASACEQHHDLFSRQERELCGDLGVAPTCEQRVVLGAVPACDQHSDLEATSACEQCCDFKTVPACEQGSALGAVPACEQRSDPRVVPACEQNVDRMTISLCQQSIDVSQPKEEFRLDTNTNHSSNGDASLEDAANESQSLSKPVPIEVDVTIEDVEKLVTGTNRFISMSKETVVEIRDTIPVVENIVNDSITTSTVPDSPITDSDDDPNKSMKLSEDLIELPRTAEESVMTVETDTTIPYDSVDYAYIPVESTRNEVAEEALLLFENNTGLTAPVVDYRFDASLNASINVESDALSCSVSEVPVDFSSCDVDNNQFMPITYADLLSETTSSDVVKNMCESECCHNFDAGHDVIMRADCDISTLDQTPGINDQDRSSKSFTLSSTDCSELHDLPVSDEASAETFPLSGADLPSLQNTVNPKFTESGAFSLSRPNSLLGPWQPKVCSSPISKRSFSSPVSHLPVYPSAYLLSHLTARSEVMQLWPYPLSDCMETLRSLSALELVNYFHSTIAPISSDNEELIDIIWSAVTLYDNPTVEILSCVLLSNKAMYFVSDVDINTDMSIGEFPNSRPITPATHQIPSSLPSTSLSQPTDTDVAYSLQVNEKPKIHPLISRTNSITKKVKQPFRVLNNGIGSVSVFETILLADLQQITVGLFSQSVRLITSDQRVVACITRDHRLSEEIVGNLKKVLSSQFMQSPSPAADVSDHDDFYKQFNRYGSMECRTSKTQVNFVYPSYEAITDIVCLIELYTKSGMSIANCNSSQSRLNGSGGANIALSLGTQDKRTVILYLLCFVTECIATNLAQSPSVVFGCPKNYQVIQNDILHSTDTRTDQHSLSGLDFRNVNLRSLILTEEYLCLAEEDHVSYPLPEFARLLPDHPHTCIAAVRSLESLRSIKLRTSNVHLISFSFSEDSDEIVVDTSVDYYSIYDKQPSVSTVPSIKETIWTAWIRNVHDRDKLIKLVSRQWSEMHSGLRLAIDVA